MTDSNRSLLIGAGIVALCAIGAAVWVGASVRGLRNELEASRKESQTQMATIIGNLGLVQGELATMRSNKFGAVAAANEPNSVAAQDGTEDEPVIEFKTDADAVALIGTVTKVRTADQLATVIGELDGWLVKPEDERSVQNRLAILISALRKVVALEVRALQATSLIATPSAVGAKKLDEAGRILALYPMSDDPGVVKEAQRLTDSQMDAATRLDALRRQRYNRWAIVRIEQAIDYYNANVSKWNPRDDNTGMLDPLVGYLGSVDPMFLEPAALELYNYIIDKMKSSLSEKNKLEFAKQLTDPKISRYYLGQL